MRRSDLVRLPLATFRRPADETGTGEPRFERLYGYLVPHPDGLALLDTGFSEGDPEADARYRPKRTPLADALAQVGRRLTDVEHLLNCHLHLDHIGGNRLVAGTPIWCQRVEHESAMAGDYTVPGAVDFPGATYELLDGAAEILPGIEVVPTPGHTRGHQSVVLHCDDGVVVLAGQTHDTASGWSADVLALDGGDDDVHAPPDWLPRLLRLEPQQVHFA